MRKEEKKEEGPEEVLRRYRIEFARSGGEAVARKMTVEERVERAKKAAKARWGGK